MERRLAAILAADLDGYSRLMAADEAGALAAVVRLPGATICDGRRFGAALAAVWGLAHPRPQPISPASPTGPPAGLSRAF